LHCSKRDLSVQSAGANTLYLQHNEAHLSKLRREPMKNLVRAVLLAGAFTLAPAVLGIHRSSAETTHPTIVLVHGAFAGSSSWNGVIDELTRNDYPVVAVAVPLRGLESDAQYVASLLASINGPVVLVGHSYGGEVISVAAADQPSVKALVFVAGFAPEVGESAASLGERFPTGTLGPTLAPPVKLTNGDADLYIQQKLYWEQFAADVPKADAVRMAVTQRPVAQSALGEKAKKLAWRKLPSWFVWGSEDRNIPAQLSKFMADRANAREAIEIPGASHVVMISHPQKVAAVIERAAK
jgi:pimeloyl-ACP methyl ester carboxylesterase